jgi:predicted P-loop ATPase
MSKYTKKLFSLGELYVSDFIEKDEDARAGKHDMTLVIDERYGAARLEKCTPIHSMFGKYWYRSGINQTMKTELKGICGYLESINIPNES